MSDITWTTAQIRLGDLIEWEHNPVTLSKHDAAEIKKSIDKFGLVLPLVANAPLEGGVRRLIDGHQRKSIMLMAKMAGKDTMVDVRVPSRPLEERECDELSIRLRRNTGEWNFEILGNAFELPDLLEWGFEKDELLGKGFDMPQGEDAGPQTDKAAELQIEYGTALGQIWQLGKHRLAVGDCTDGDTITRLLCGKQANMILNDPPYGMRLDADFSGMVNKLEFARDKGIAGGTKYANVIGDDQDYDASPIMAIFDQVKEQFWFGADSYAITLGDTSHSGAWLVWDKRLDESADKMYGSCFELLWSRTKHKRDVLRHKWAGVFGTEHEPQRGRVHPNQKPVALYEDILTRYSEEGWIIVDCYAGSGTTGIACERLGRQARMVEIDPGYGAVVLKRWEDLVGEKAVLLGN